MFDFSSFKEELKKDKEILLNRTTDFFLFMVFAILGTLVFYIQTQDELAATIWLSILWLFFWKESDLRGKVFLTTASIVGYVHELIGVKAGFFTYLGGFFAGVPLWVIPGYGAIFWASYNMYRIFEKSYSGKKWFSYVNPAAAGSIIVLLALDYTLFDLSLRPVITILEASLSFLLFRSVSEWRLAYFVGLFTVFDELAGEFIGTWSHEFFSLISLMSAYIFLLWMCLTITDILKGEKKWGLVEAISAILLFVIFGISVMQRL